MSMKLRLVAIPIAALVLAAIGLAPQAQAQTPPPPAGPTSGTKVASGLISPRGMKVASDGTLYVAEAGSGGTIAVGSGASASKSGPTGRISKVDPASGGRTTIADKLPSNAGPEGDAVGPADVAFLSGQLYYVQTHGGTAYGFPSNPTGIYKVNADGTVTLLADIGAYNIANPVGDISSGKQKDIEIGGNPYSMTVRDGAFYVVDGNQNQILKVTAAGVITRVNEFPGHPVTTGITYNGAGPFYVTALGQFPFAPADGKLYSVSFPGGTVASVTSGFSSLTDAEFGFGGQLYVLQFGDQSTSPAGPPWQLGSGKILRVNLVTGALTPIVNGFTFPTSLVFDGDTAYVANGGLTIPGVVPGEIWQIKNFSSVQPITLAPPAAAPVAPPPAPAPAPQPPTGTAGGASGVPVRAPNTGAGPQASQLDGWLPALLALGVAGALCVAGGTRKFGKRDA